MPSPSEHFPDLTLPPPEMARALPISGPPFARPGPDTIERMRGISSATASALLHRMGVRRAFIQGPVTRQPGTRVVGPAVTLQFMPQREDVASGLGQEHVEKVSALWAVFETVEPGDVLAVQAFGDPTTGCMGEMLLTYFHGRGGVGVVVDGCIRDWPRVQEIGVPVWTRGFTPNYASQSGLFPWAYNVPIACGGVLVLPGDIVIADDDGAVLVPQQMAELLIEHGGAHEDWEIFSRLRLAEGGSLMKYYPLSDEGWVEYEAWRAQNGEGGIA